MGKVYPFLSKLADPPPLAPNRRKPVGDDAITQRVVMKRPVFKPRVDWRGRAITFGVVVLAIVVGTAFSLCLCRLMGIA